METENSHKIICLNSMLPFDDLMTSPNSENRDHSLPNIVHYSKLCQKTPLFGLYLFELSV